MMDGDDPAPAYPDDATDALELAQSPAGETEDPAHWYDRETVAMADDCEVRV